MVSLDFSVLSFHMQVWPCRQSWTAWSTGECILASDSLKRLAEKDSLSPPVSVLRLHHLETKVIEDVGKTPDIICELKSQVESFKRKLEVRHAHKHNWT